MASVDIDALIHEMRNELTVAKANLEAVVDGKLAPTQERLLGVIQALNQLDGLIEDLRLLGPEAAMPVRPALINVCALLNREYSSIEAIAAAKNITVTIHRCSVPVAPCVHFYGDPTRIGQIIKNIFLNAIRYTPAGGAVSIDCGRREDQLEVNISDRGPGVGRHEAEAIFQEGYRGSASAGKQGSGVGLGIVKRLVEEQGGAVTTATTTARGARFTVRLPGTPSGQVGCDSCAPRTSDRDVY